MSREILDAERGDGAIQRHGDHQLAGHWIWVENAFCVIFALTAGPSAFCPI